MMPGTFSHTYAQAAFMAVKAKTQRMDRARELPADTPKRDYGIDWL